MSKKKIAISPGTPKKMNISYVQRIKDAQNRKIFNMLNPDSKGNISKRTVLEVKLPNEVYDKIGRIVEELIELDEELNFEEFCKAIEILECEELEKSMKSEKIGSINEFT